MNTATVSYPLPDITADYLERPKGVLRYVMTALRANLENWERKEYEAVRRHAIAEIRSRIAAVRELRGPSFSRLDDLQAVFEACRVTTPIWVY